MRNAFLYYFLRAAVRLNRLLHYQPSDYEKIVRWPNAGGRLGVELAFALTTVFLGVLFLAVLQLARSSRNYNKVVRPFGGFVFLFAFPLTYVLLFDRCDNRTLALDFSVAIPELLCAAVLCLIYVLRPFSAWGVGILLLLHYCLWALVYQGSGAAYAVRTHPSSTSPSFDSAWRGRLAVLLPSCAQRFLNRAIGKTVVETIARCCGCVGGGIGCAVVARPWLQSGSCEKS